MCKKQSEPSLNSIYNCCKNFHNGAIRSKEHTNICENKLEQMAMNVIGNRRRTWGSVLAHEQRDIELTHKSLTGTDDNLLIPTQLCRLLRAYTNTFRRS